MYEPIWIGLLIACMLGIAFAVGFNKGVDSIIIIKEDEEKEDAQ